MNAKAYSAATARTWNTDGDEMAQLANATWGLVGEMGEFLLAQNVDELGDIYYYTATLARLLDCTDVLDALDLDDTWAENFMRDHRTWEVRMAGTDTPPMLESMKKWKFHNKPDAYDNAVRHLLEICIRLNKAAYDLYSTPQDVMKQNIAKLTERHPDGWDANNH